MAQTLAERRIYKEESIQSVAGKLLKQYTEYTALTDEEAATLAGVTQYGYWKRCADLRRWGFIRFTGVTQPSPTTGRYQNLSTITSTGLNVAAMGEL